MAEHSQTLSAKWTIGTAAAALVAGCLVGAKASPYLLLAFALVAVAIASARGSVARPVLRETLVWPSLLFVLAALSAFWSAAPREAVIKGAIGLAGVGIVHVVHANLRNITSVPADLARAIVIGFCIGLAFLAVELATGQAIKLLIFNRVAFLKPTNPRSYEDWEGRWGAVISDDLNWSIGALNLLAWPAALAVMCLPARPRDRSLAVMLLIGATALVTMASSHETSKLAVLAGVLVFLMHRRWPQRARKLVLGAFVAICLLVVPVAYFIYQAGAYRIGWLPSSVHSRLVIWGFTAERVRLAPILGVGVQTTQLQAPIFTERKEQPADHPHPRRTGRHAHNVYLQTWYELGAVGAGLLLATGLGLMHAIELAAAAARPFLTATATVMAVIIATSWGMWQPWFMAILFITILLGSIGAWCLDERRSAFDGRSQNAIQARS